MYYLYFQNGVFFITHEEDHKILFYNFVDKKWKDITQVDRRCYCEVLLVSTKIKDIVNILYMGDDCNLYLEERNKNGYIKMECLLLEVKEYLQEGKLQINFMFE